ncbi:MAG TPA: DUF1440 domain-containing protein [Ktedonobacter sp.]|nr:DUF1440 domain-containing protein [Ktedonobacter sp.]
MTMDKEPSYLHEQEGQQAWLSGTLGGFLAAAPMGVFMIIVHSFLPKWQQYALPPERITDALAARVGLRKKMDGEQHWIATIVAHFLYSAFVGTLYQPLTRRITLPTILKGTLFGVFIWAVGYAVLVPLLKIPESSSAQKQPLPRNLMMIAAHVVWGILTAEISKLVR